MVSPDRIGARRSPTALVDEAKRLSPGGVTLLVNKDNARAIRFYERNGFVHAGEDVNPTSGRPVLKMSWTEYVGSASNAAEQHAYHQDDIGERQHVKYSAQR